MPPGLPIMPIVILRNLDGQFRMNKLRICKKHTWRFIQGPNATKSFLICRYHELIGKGKHNHELIGKDMESTYRVFLNLSLWANSYDLTDLSCSTTTMTLNQPTLLDDLNLVLEHQLG